MTRLKLNKILVDCAIEDMGIAKERGQVAIEQTLKGLITLEHDNECYRVMDRFGDYLTGLMDGLETIEYLTGAYDCSDAEVIRDK